MWKKSLQYRQVRNQYYEHLKLTKKKNVWRVFNSHLPENTKVNQHSHRTIKNTFTSCYYLEGPLGSV